MWRAKPSMKSYWLRCASSAITTMLRRSESVGCRSPFSSGKNFWMVVKTTPPAATLQQLAQVRAALGLHRRLAQQVLAAREGAEELVVEVVAVGEHDEGRVLHRRLADDAPGVEGHRQALARALRVPDHADAPVARLAAGLAGPPRSGPRPRPRGRPRGAARRRAASRPPPPAPRGTGGSPPSSSTSRPPPSSSKTMKSRTRSRKRRGVEDALDQHLQLRQVRIGQASRPRWCARA